jgi:multiple sugar transport system permease protein
VVHALLVLAALYCVLPLIWLVTAATKSMADFSATGAFELGEWNLGANLRGLFSHTPASGRCSAR